MMVLLLFGAVDKIQLADLIPAPIRVMDSMNIRHVGGWPYGPAYKVVSNAPLAYVSTGAGIHVIDLSDPSNPVKLHEFPAEGFIWNLLLNDPYLYLAEGIAGIQIFDISNPTAPSLVAHIRDIPMAFNTSIAGNILAVSMLDSGMAFFDISDPYSPSLLGQYSTPACPALDGAIYANYAYIACSDSGIVILDISDPSDPTFLGRLTPGTIEFIEVKEDYLFVTGLDADFLVYDLSTNPAAPSQVGQYVSFHYPKDMALSGNWALIVEGIGTLYVLDISDPTTPTRIVYYYNDDYFTGVSSVDSIVLIAGMDSSLLVVDISVIAHPQLLDIYRTPRSTWKVDAEGSIAVTLDDGGMRIFDISDISSPLPAGYVPGSDWVEDAAISNQLGFLADEFDLYIFDLNDPSNPQLISTYASPGYISEIQIIGQRIYLADGYSGVVIVDISDPANPTELGRISTSGYISRISTDGTTALASEFDKVHIVDVGNPTNPQIVNTMQFGGYISGVSLYNSNYALITQYDSLLHVVDISDPYNPAEIQTINMNDRISNIDISSNVAYLLTGLYPANLIALDLTDIENPAQIGFYTLPFYATELKATEDYVFVAAAGSGLHIYQLYRTDLEEGRDHTPAYHIRWNTPGKFDFTIEIGSDDAQPLYVYDIRGRLLITRYLSTGENRIRKVLPPGIYVLKIGPHIHKIVIK